VNRKRYRKTILDSKQVAQFNGGIIQKIPWKRLSNSQIQGIFGAGFFG
jgi:hypothetical protein